MKTQIFALGASFGYGIGGPAGGWPDMLKRDLHQEQYAGEFTEATDVYSFGKPGMMCCDVLACAESDIRHRLYGKSNVIVAIHLGMNDSRAKDTIDGFVNTPENFSKELGELFTLVKQFTNDIIYIDGSPADESKTMPKVSPLDGTMSYFSNKRIGLFSQLAGEVASKHGVAFVDVFTKAESMGWHDYIAADGLHPNGAGHLWLYEQIAPVIREKLVRFDKWVHMSIRVQRGLGWM